jgi:hypothetical protein
VALRGVILCVLVARIVVKLGIRLLFWKSLQEKSYHVRSLMAFRAIGVGNGHGHGIVCLIGQMCGPVM